ncbi:MarR family winged helix-turn-helix transcriptional regulator [Streptomyces sp. DSM 40750]|uniref:MarR family winged helix-turn-helix transcriptional regulator n=1 Tax=Streptomyces sp. DSM 40750 TaxID=2801030 RepID=UPI00214B5AF9|nr:MarR family transcriptional regulator [Streptomyces sp. DSM 40750]UUU19630.1 MarR family transcriptional regulator [Streptomyces sp. DSM 40750]UUU27028.1 MarR family transcriptional regulator [Streptomyces sp. DSM 40750]
MTATSDPVDAWMQAWRTELPEVVFPSSELSKRIMFLSAALDRVTRRDLTELGLTVAEFDVLVTLRRAGEPYRMKPNQLARSLMLSTGGTTNVTHRLVARGAVEREGDPADARSTWIRLTPDGIALAERAVLAMSAEHDAFFEGVPAEIVDAATAALRDLITACPGLLPRGSAARDARAQGRV